MILVTKILKKYIFNYFFLFNKNKKMSDLLLDKYKYDCGSNDRQQSLDGAIIEYGPEVLLKKLKSLPSYQNSNLKKNIDGDIMWLQNRYKYQFKNK